MKKIEKSLTDLFVQPETLLSSIIYKTQHLQQLTLIVRSLLETKLGINCQVANFRDDNLFIETNNATWCTILRYQLPNLLAKLQLIEEFSGIKKINCYVLPKNSEASLPKKTLFLSDENANILTATANHITSTELQAALRKLASNKIRGE